MTSDDLKRFLRETFGLRREPEDDTPLFSQGLLDSFSMIELIDHVEKRAGIKIGPMEVTLENLDSIERILAFVRSKQTA